MGQGLWWADFWDEVHSQDKFPQSQKSLRMLSGTKYLVKGNGFQVFGRWKRGAACFQWWVRKEFVMLSPLIWTLGEWGLGPGLRWLWLVGTGPRWQNQSKHFQVPLTLFLLVDSIFGSINVSTWLCGVCVSLFLLWGFLCSSQQSYQPSAHPLTKQQSCHQEESSCPAVPHSSLTLACSSSEFSTKHCQFILVLSLVKLWILFLSQLLLSLPSPRWEIEDGRVKGLGNMEPFCGILYKLNVQ